jgi:hypothetical protein
MRESGGPLRHERSLPLATERDEGEDVWSFLLLVLDFGPGVVDQLRLRLAPDEFRRGVFDDAADVSFEIARRA